MGVVRPMNGILVINKPTGISSHDCVNIIRKAMKTKKVGHAGTLDVEASGVLVLGINKGTKLLNYLNQDDKTYRFDVVFGITTDTLDHAGAITDEQPLQSPPDIDAALPKFIGTYTQMPPAYSAVKVGGKKLYEYAREGKPIPEVNARDLTVHELYRTTPVVFDEGRATCGFYLRASKGIYVRQLASDLAETLGTVAHTTAIHRVAAGDFTIDEAIDLDHVNANTPLISLANALRSMPEKQVAGDDLFKAKHGQPLRINADVAQLKIVDERGKLVAIYERKETDYRAKNVFA